jgi:hypothetical protein
VCAPEWRETPVTCNIEDLNYLEIGIKGDEVSVYLNKGFAPAYRVNFEGLGSVEATAPFLAFNIFNVSAEFSELAISDGERIFKNEIAPSVSMIGDKVTTATVGKKVSIPVVVASSAIETGSAQVTIKVTFNGEEITLEKNSFIPQTAGEYVVTITATDDWSLTTTEVYTITVTEAQDGDSNVDDGKTGCTSSMGVSSTLMLAVFGIATVALKKRR